VNVSEDLDRRFRELAAAEGTLDVAYDFVDTPLGSLLVAQTERGLCQIGFDPEPERDLDPLARLFGSKVLRVPKALDAPKRELDEYFAGSRTEFELAVDVMFDSFRPPRDGRARTRALRLGDDVRRARGQGGEPARRPRGRDVHEPQPDPDRPPVPPRGRSERAASSATAAASSGRNSSCSSRGHR
jgi:methylated-DNA-[protein]-cysteine S-methyltransferase